MFEKHATIPLLFKLAAWQPPYGGALIHPQGMLYVIDILAVAPLSEPELSVSLYVRSHTRVVLLSCRVRRASQRRKAEPMAVTKD
jgi:hypothetical protein